MRALASATLIAATLLAREASACDPDPCTDAVAVVDLERTSSAEVPTDGVLVIKATIAGDLDPEDLQSRINITVTQSGTDIPGKLELGEFPNLLLWRPAAPLTPGAIYDVSALLTNPNPAPNCGDSPDPISLTFTAAATPTAPIVAPIIKVSTGLFDEPLLTLTGVVCCNDAYPGDQIMCGVSYGLTWSKGLCTALESRGYLRVQLNADPATDPASASQWARVLRQDGEVVTGGTATTFVREIDTPTCFQIDQLNLATRARAEGEEQCFGESDQDKLGVHPLDPAAALGDKCVSDLYRCELKGDYWNPARCTSYGVEPPPTDDPLPPPTSDGCGCNSTRHPTALLLLLLLLGSRRSPLSRRARAA